MSVFLMGLVSSLFTQATKKFGINPQFLAFLCSIVGAIGYYFWSYYSNEVDPAKAKEIVTILISIWTSSVGFYEIIIKKLVK